ncbi:MAG TPA: hypothetical protein VG870_12105 [Chitinophagaceae bacterium]|nr:hypothetical protein [Chitinophagaceae bacterium]
MNIKKSAFLVLFLAVLGWLAIALTARPVAGRGLPGAAEPAPGGGSARSAGLTSAPEGLTSQFFSAVCLQP